MTRIEIYKSERRLVLTTAAGESTTYRVALGRNAAADKAVEGDHATPEGEFYVCAKNPRSRYFLSLCLSYPNAEDADRGLRSQLITKTEYAQILDALRAEEMPPQHTALGGEIYIHGHGDRSEGGSDWTRGCIALSNADMQVVYDASTIGTPVIVVSRAEAGASTPGNPLWVCKPS